MRVRGQVLLTDTDEPVDEGWVEDEIKVGLAVRGGQE